MEIDNRYRIPDITYNFKVVEALDFSGAPYLLLERDLIGNRYISYLIEEDSEYEQRIYIQISERKFSLLASESLSVREVFETSENQTFIITKFSVKTGKLLESYLIPAESFDVSFIPINYFVAYDAEEIIEDESLINYSIQAQKLVFDFYLHGQNLIENIKPYALYKVFTPIVEMIKKLVGFDNRNADKYIAFSNLRHSSLGITIEVNYSHDLFLDKEKKALDILTKLLNAQEKEDFISIVSQTQDSSYIVHYKSIIKAIIDNNADLTTAYANPIESYVRKSYINKEKAIIAKKVIDETFDVIEDVEEIVGRFFEIDLTSKEPSFKILPIDEVKPISGKFELSLINSLIEDKVNLGKEEYVFTVKTLYHPETVVNKEDIKRYMLKYEKYEAPK
ncbi:hypothetical protein KJK34_11845 [Flavobacterium sp. D11R37]|uniref:hypothetical protein n=1 Tax=Flavobacterium coralii TaxID=2838017 RepID=UPI001CA6110E|nr:hypothetical protein [Flavobacterium coralii]MBY8963447.1 hypothetical protein [Flavobacterium coralii]